MLRLIRKIVALFKMKTNPVSYFRSIGVKIGDGTVFYDPDLIMFSTEPYLVSIGSNCHITSGVCFIPHDGGVFILRHKHPDIDLVAPIKIGNRVFIGFKSIILAGVSIGDDCIIGAGSLVTKDVPSGSVVAGVPAKFIKSIEAYEKTALEKSVDTKRLSPEAKKKRLLEIFNANSG